MNICVKLTVFFDDPFWVGVFEKTYKEKYQVAKITFGPEPKDYEVFDFIQKNYYGINFSTPLAVEKRNSKRINPKRLQRKINREMQNEGIGTKAQNAIKLEMEAKKITRKKQSKAEKEEFKKRMYELKQEKKKQKKRGH